MSVPVPVVLVPVHVPLVHAPVRLVEQDKIVWSLKIYGDVSSKEDKTGLLLLQR